VHLRIEACRHSSPARKGARNQQDGGLRRAGRP
jgi:hypothetical protein